MQPTEFSSRQRRWWGLQPCGVTRVDTLKQLTHTCVSQVLPIGTHKNCKEEAEVTLNLFSVEVLSNYITFKNNLEPILCERNIT